MAKSTNIYYFDVLGIKTWRQAHALSVCLMRSDPCSTVLPACVYMFSCISSARAAHSLTVCVVALYVCMCIYIYIYIYREREIDIGGDGALTVTRRPPRVWRPDRPRAERLAIGIMNGDPNIGIINGDPRWGGFVWSQIKLKMNREWVRRDGPLKNGAKPI